MSEKVFYATEYVYFYLGYNACELMVRLFTIFLVCFLVTGCSCFAQRIHERDSLYQAYFGWDYDEDFERVAFDWYGDYQEFKSKGKVGLKEAKTGGVILRAVFDRVSAPLNKRILVKRNGKKGIYKIDGHELVPCVYDSIRSWEYSNAYFIRVDSQGSQGFIDSTGKIRVPCMYEALQGLGGRFNKARLKGKWALIDDDNTKLTAFVFDDMGDEIGEGMVAIQNTSGYWGYIDTAGRIVIPPFSRKSGYTGKGLRKGGEARVGDGHTAADEKKAFTNAGVFVSGYAPVEGKPGWAFIDRHGLLVTPFIYDEVEQYENGYHGIRKGSKWGFADKSGKAITPFDFDRVAGFVDGFAQVTKNRKVGLVNRNGVLVVPCKYERMGHRIFDGLTTGKCYLDKGSFTELIDTNGRSITGNRYEEIHDFDGYGRESGFLIGGLVCVTKHGWDFMGRWAEMFGYINRKGEEVIQCKFSWATNFDDGIAEVDFNGMKQYIDTAGHIVRLPAKPGLYRLISEFSEGLAAVTNEHSYRGYINEKGIEVIACNYEETMPFHNGLAGVQLDGKWGFINRQGRIIVSCIYDRVENFSDGMGLVKKGEKFGFVDTTGKVVIPLIYDKAAPFSEGLSLVDFDLKHRENGSRGFINKKGKLEIKYSGSRNSKCQFHDSIAAACDFDELFLIDHQGKELRYSDSSGGTPEHYWYGYYADGLVSFYRKGKFGFVNKEGQFVIQPRWDDVSAFDGGVAVVGKYLGRTGDHADLPIYEYGLIDRNGKVIIECQYSKIGRFANESLALVDNGSDCWWLGGGVKPCEKYGYINKKGKLVLPMIYEQANDFSDGIAAVKFDGHWRIIDAYGKVLVQMK